MRHLPSTGEGDVVEFAAPAPLSLVCPVQRLAQVTHQAVSRAVFAPPLALVSLAASAAGNNRGQAILELSLRTFHFHPPVLAFG